MIPRGNMRPRFYKGKFNDALIVQCRNFAKKQQPTSVDQYAKRGQDPSKYYREIIQLSNGKLGEELSHAAYVSRFPQLTRPDYEIYTKEDKDWEPDLIDPVSGIHIAVKTKDIRDAAQWGASWIFEKTDRKIFGDRLDNQNLDPNQYVCLVIVDPVNKKGELKACVKLQWLHDHELFTNPDRDYLKTKLTVRLENMEKMITDPSELWQLV